jgi:hypothetical protein
VAQVWDERHPLSDKLFGPFVYEEVSKLREKNGSRLQSLPMLGYHPGQDVSGSFLSS